MNKDKSVYGRVCDLITYGNIHLSADTADNAYLYKTLLARLNLPLEECGGCISDSADLEGMTGPDGLLSHFDANDREPLIAALLPLPSRLNELFNSFLEHNEAYEGTEWFYDLCVKSGYVRAAASENNIHWRLKGEKGELQITINTCVPYYNDCRYDSPRCPSCEGADGSLIRREIPLRINNEDWAFMFSPYNLFPRHFIFCPAGHTAGKVDTGTYAALLDAVECFNHYFFAANADVSGLCKYDNSHACFTGGLAALPMFSAAPRMLFDDPGGFVKISVLDWYNTVIRLESGQRHAILGMAERITQGWERFADKKTGIANKPADRNNGIAPVIRINGDGEYCAELILRNNKLPRPDETLVGGGIGVLESLGAFVLDGAVSKAAAAACSILCGDNLEKGLEKAAKDKELKPYIGLIKDMVANGACETAEKDIERYIETACENALKSTAVFKDDGAGNMALINFMASMNLNLKR